MKKFAVPCWLVLDKTVDHLIAYSVYRRADKVFLVEAETAKKAANAVKRRCKENGINVARIDDGIVVESLPTSIVVSLKSKV